MIDFYGINKTAFDMPVDFLLKFSSNKFISFFQRLICFFRLLPQCDIWHFNYMDMFFFYPLNLLLLKIFRKKIILTFRGSDVRWDFDFLPKRILTVSKINLPEYYANFYQSKSFLRVSKQKLRIKISTFFADKITLNGPFLISFVKRYDCIIPYDCNLSSIKRISKNAKRKSKKIRVVHAPTKKDVKGTDYVEKIFNKLAKKYPNCEFKVLSNLDHPQLLQEVAKSDIVIDQLMVGWYGTFGAEAMALGKPVLAFLNPIYLRLVEYGEHLPIYNTNITTLERDLEFLINSPIERKKRARESQIFAKKYHDARKTANLYLEVYGDCFK